MAGNNKHSIEERVEDWCKQQFKGQKYYTKTESINSEIEEALRKAPSKKGGTGTNFPDIKCFIQTATMRRIPVMIEVKGTRGDSSNWMPTATLTIRRKTMSQIIQI